MKIYENYIDVYKVNKLCLWWMRFFEIANILYAKFGLRYSKLYAKVFIQLLFNTSNHRRLDVLLNRLFRRR